MALLPGFGIRSDKDERGAVIKAHTKLPHLITSSYEQAASHSVEVCESYNEMEA